MRDEDRSGRDTGTVVRHEETEQTMMAGSTKPRKMEQTLMADKLRHEWVRTARPVDNSDTRTPGVADAGGGHHRSIKKTEADTNAGQH